MTQNAKPETVCIALHTKCYCELCRTIGPPSVRRELAKAKKFADAVECARLIILTLRAACTSGYAAIMLDAGIAEDVINAALALDNEG